MKKVLGFAVLSAFMLTASCKKEEGTAMMTFAESSYDFGEIKQGEKVTHIFKFKNEGKADLVITDAKGSCGCTVPEYPKTPVKVGAEGEIKVIFNSAGKHGEQHKSVTITANTAKKKEIINIQGNVIEAGIGVIQNP